MNNQYMYVFLAFLSLTYCMGVTAQDEIDDRSKNRSKNPFQGYIDSQVIHNMSDDDKRRNSESASRLKMKGKALVKHLEFLKKLQEMSPSEHNYYQMLIDNGGQFNFAIDNRDRTAEEIQDIYHQYGLTFERQSKRTDETGISLRIATYDNISGDKYYDEFCDKHFPDKYRGKTKQYDFPGTSSGSNSIDSAGRPIHGRTTKSLFSILPQFERTRCSTIVANWGGEKL